MKRILALILSLILLFTVALIAYAEDDNLYKVGDIVALGSYPQSLVTDSETKKALIKLSSEWTSYGYYSGDDSFGSMVQGDWMYYTDVIYNGSKYRGVMFDLYRPITTEASPIGNNSYVYINDYRTYVSYWYKFEPIEWRVLDPDTGLVVCETIIDSQPYSNTLYKGMTSGYFSDLLCTDFAVDYGTSSIRNWLNNDFYNTAFTDEEKKRINITTLDNDSYWTSVGATGGENLDFDSTNDKVFLLSYKEATNLNFGFNSEKSEYDIVRQAKVSDYAKIQGCGVMDGNSSWLLRSAGNIDSCCFVSYKGDILLYQQVNMLGGIRPALRLHNHCYVPTITTPATHLKEGVKTLTCYCGDTYTESIEKIKAHTYDSVVTYPTCTEQGFTTYTCVCGDSYVGNYVNENGHSYTSKIIIPATHTSEGVRMFICHCGDNYAEVIANIKEHTYNSVVTAPTCTEQGFTTYTCTCGDSYVGDYVNENGHRFTNYISDGKATCVTDGYKISKCDNCNETDSIAEKGEHSFSAEWTIDVHQTCTSEGSKSHHCNNCDEKADVTPIEKLEHSYIVSVVEPDCTNKGYKFYTCACGDSYFETMAQLGHVFDDGDKDCKNCGFDRTKECSCNCHRDGFIGFIFKIIIFFQTIFQQNKVCACGIYHY